MTLAPQPDERREVCLGQPELSSQGADVHDAMFADGERLGKQKVRYLRNDGLERASHNANMAKSKRTNREYQALREASGWYAAAWRDWRKLTLQELADELNTSRGLVSDLETGTKNKNGKQKRFNRDWLDGFCRALNVAAGDLIDTNPFSQDPRFEIIKRTFSDLDDMDRQAVTNLAESLGKRRA